MFPRAASGAVLAARARRALVAVGGDARLETSNNTEIDDRRMKSVLHVKCSLKLREA